MEKRHGSKTWEIEAGILNETNKILQEKGQHQISSISDESKIVNELGKAKGRELD